MAIQQTSNFQLNHTLCFKSKRDWLLLEQNHCIQWQLNSSCIFCKFHCNLHTYNGISLTI